MDKDKKSEYNRRYYEKHKADILAKHKMAEKKPAPPIDKEAHRKAAREWYHRNKARLAASKMDDSGKG